MQFEGADSDVHLNKDEVRQCVWSKYKDLHNYLLFEDQLETTQKIIRELYPQATIDNVIEAGA